MSFAQMFRLFITYSNKIENENLSRIGDGIYAIFNCLESISALLLFRQGNQCSSQKTSSVEIRFVLYFH